jgi:hypothetical protein
MDLRERRDETQARHPWELARRRFVLELLQRHGALANARRVLDIGSGDAWMSGQVKRELQRPDAELVAWDTNYTDDDLQQLGKNGVQVTRAAPAGRFDLVMLLDVLEHVQDDVTMLRELVERHVAPGATIVVTVPAWPQLRSRHDEVLLHHRRYTNASARALLAGAGLDITLSGGVFHGLLLQRAGAVVAEKLFVPPRDEEHGVGHWRGGRALTSLITGVLAAESKASLALAERGVDAPGLSFFALCTRPP